MERRSSLKLFYNKSIENLSCINEFLKKYFVHDFSFKNDVKRLLDNFEIDYKHKIVLCGLLELENGQVISYSDFARSICFEKQTRNIATLIGKNPLPIIIPCHLVVRKNYNNHDYGNYIFGREMKRVLIDFESKKLDIINDEYRKIISDFYNKK